MVMNLFKTWVNTRCRFDRKPYKTAVLYRLQFPKPASLSSKPMHYLTIHKTTDDYFFQALLSAAPGFNQYTKEPALRGRQSTKLDPQNFTWRKHPGDRSMGSDPHIQKAARLLQNAPDFDTASGQASGQTIDESRK
jgi:hypothetical protein